MCFWRRRVKIQYRIESIHLDEQVDPKRDWIIIYRSNPACLAYDFILKNLHLGKDLSISVIDMLDAEEMVIEFEGYKQDIKDFINTLIKKDINFIKWYKITTLD